MYVYIQSETSPDLFTVGFYHPDDNKWEPDSDHPTRDEAAGRVAYLNGTNKPVQNNLFKDPYVRLSLEDSINVVAKLDDEGISLDAYDEDGELIDGTWKLYQEMIDGDEEEE